MKKLFVLALLVTLSFSLEGRAYGNIVISINNQIHKLKNGDVVRLYDGDRICYVAGSGEFEVLNRSVNEDSYSCLNIVKDSSSNKYKIMDKIIKVLLTSTDTEVNGVTLRAPSIEVDFNNEKYLRLSVKNKSLPLKVKIYTNNRVYTLSVNKNDILLSLANYKKIKKVVFLDKNNKKIVEIKQLQI
ncbi:hypothetical protein [Caminibacter pacificus]|uniref:Uncharacterized protein n=1 Tax=Caminibacter pacificus TaxID=1424653 RepID=A0AAJ4UY14_9BACT|nr:hypothetical protein [Caminibacter pacificus]QCI27619.1 hypothetical protein C6V80_01165 [Caminibacter pacificus]ROR40204.1 hypothetical protein EDC58_1192 [Caminibacter pacificus]